MYNGPFQPQYFYDSCHDENSLISYGCHGHDRCQLSPVKRQHQHDGITDSAKPLGWLMIRLSESSWKISHVKGETSKRWFLGVLKQLEPWPARGAGQSEVRDLVRKMLRNTPAVGCSSKYHKVLKSMDPGIVEEDAVPPSQPPDRVIFRY